MKNIFWIATILFLSVTGCQKVTEPSAEETPAEAPTAPQSQVDKGSEGSISVANVVLKPGQPDAVTLTVEIAATADERLEGLKHRESLPEKHGMWFIFQGDVKDAFWMQDTLISLDIIFVDKDYKIVKIIENAVPKSEELLDPGVAYRYTLELVAGSARKFNLKIGDTVEYRVGPA